MADEQKPTLDVVIDGAIKDFRCIIGVKVRVDKPEMQRYALVEAERVHAALRERFPDASRLDSPRFLLNPHDGIVDYAHDGERHLIPLTELGYDYNEAKDQYFPVEPTGQLRLF